MLYYSKPRIDKMAVINVLQNLGLVSSIYLLAIKLDQVSLKVKTKSCESYYECFLIKSCDKMAIMIATTLSATLYGMNSSGIAMLCFGA